MDLLEMTESTQPESIARVLMYEIFSGAFPAGTRLPAERTLTKRFHVTRQAVREALRRLETLGLVKSRRGSGTYAEDARGVAGLELFQSLVVTPEGTLDLALIEDYFEFRISLSKQIVRLAVERRTDDDLVALREALARRAAVLHDAAALNEANVHIYKLVARATHNRVYQLAMNSAARMIDQFHTRIPASLFDPRASQRRWEEGIEAIAQRDLKRALDVTERDAEELRTIVKGLLTALASGAQGRRGSRRK